MSEQLKLLMVRVAILSPDLKQVMLHRRPKNSFIKKNQLQLIGGKVERDDVDPYTAILREVAEELRLYELVDFTIFAIEDLFNDDTRWPTVAFYLILRNNIENVIQCIESSVDSAEASRLETHQVTELPEIVFSGNEIIATALAAHQQRLVLEGQL